MKLHSANSTKPSENTPDLARRDSLICIALSAAAIMVALPPSRAQAFSFADLTQQEAGSGVKAALQRGAEVAVSLLGAKDGFWGNDKVRIPLPQWLEQGQSVLKMMGRGKDIDELKIGVNRAAEQAVPEAKALLLGAVQSMSVVDAKNILTGGDNSVTQFFKSKTEKPLGESFLPIVTSVTDKIGLAGQYNKLAGQGEKMGLIKPDQAKIERHVTNKALDGLFFMIGEEEKKIRTNPMGAGSDILSKVFGAKR